MFHPPAHKDLANPAGQIAFPVPPELLAGRRDPLFIARRGLVAVLETIERLNAKLDDENQEDGPRSPTGDDFNNLAIQVQTIAIKTLRESLAVKVASELAKERGPL